MIAVFGDGIMQRLANFFYKGPDSKYFKFCRPRGKIEDIIWNITNYRNSNKMQKTNCFVNKIQNVIIVIEIIKNYMSTHEKNEVLFFFFFLLG